MNCEDPIKSSFDSNNNLFKVEEHEKLIVSLREETQNDSDYKIDKESVDSSDREFILEVGTNTTSRITYILKGHVESFPRIPWSICLASDLNLHKSYIIIEPEIISNL